MRSSNSSRWRTDGVTSRPPSRQRQRWRPRRRARVTSPVEQRAQPAPARGAPARSAADGRHACSDDLGAERLRARRRARAPVAVRRGPLARRRSTRCAPPDRPVAASRGGAARSLPSRNREQIDVGRELRRVDLPAGAICAAARRRARRGSTSRSARASVAASRSAKRRELRVRLPATTSRIVDARRRAARARRRSARAPRVDVLERRPARRRQPDRHAALAIQRQPVVEARSSAPGDTTDTRRATGTRQRAGRHRSDGRRRRLRASSSTAIRGDGRRLRVPAPARD